MRQMPHYSYSVSYTHLDVYKRQMGRHWNYGNRVQSFIIWRKKQVSFCRKMPMRIMKLCNGYFSKWHQLAQCLVKLVISINSMARKSKIKDHWNAVSYTHLDVYKRQRLYKQRKLATIDLMTKSMI